MKTKLLLLEDDIELSETVEGFLEDSGFEVATAYDAIEAKNLIYEQQFDLLLFDIQVPRQNGLSLLNDLRSEGFSKPVIFLTARNSEDDVIKGFDAGCDDYLRKPFSLKELQVRINSLLKREFSKKRDNCIKIDETLCFDVTSYILKKENKEIELNPKEANLLKILLQNRGSIVTKEEISNSLWNYSNVPNDASIRTYIKILRSSVGKDKISTIKNIGYRFENDI